MKGENHTSVTSGLSDPLTFSPGAGVWVTDYKTALSGPSHSHMAASHMCLTAKCLTAAVGCSQVPNQGLTSLTCTVFSYKQHVHNVTKRFKLNKMKLIMFLMHNNEHEKKTRRGLASVLSSVIHQHRG